MALDGVIFCLDPASPQSTDEIFNAEWSAVEKAGGICLLVDHDDAVAGRWSRALRRLPERKPPLRVAYRGWMLSGNQYRDFFDALSARGYVLLTDPASYVACHHLPLWYSALRDCTPRTVWIAHGPPYSDAELFGLLAELRGAAIVKDFVKSEKQDWLGACFIPDVSNLQQARRVVDRFCELRGEQFEGGLVLREFVPLRTETLSPREGHLEAEEVRVFWLHAAPLAVLGRTCGAAADTAAVLLSRFQPLAARIPSPFFSMDLARKLDGDWIVIELGDGQVSGLPDGADAAGPLIRTLLARGSP